MIINKQAKINENDNIKNWSNSAFDLVNNVYIKMKQLLQRKANLRLGNDKPGLAKSHEFFNGFDWDSLVKGTMKSPFEGVVKL